MLEYWGGEEYGRPPPGMVSFKFKMDTDLYDLAKAKTRPCSISFSPDGKSMAVTSRDKQVLGMYSPARRNRFTGILLLTLYHR